MSTAAVPGMGRRNAPDAGMVVQAVRLFTDPPPDEQAFGV
jgi:hypothetical protein